MKKLVAAVLVLGMALSSAALAGGTIASAPLAGPFSLAAKGIWQSPCTKVIPPFDVYVSALAGADVSVQRYADAGCVYAIRDPLTVSLAAPAPPKPNACYLAPSSCGDVASPDAVPHMAIRVTITDTSGAPNKVFAVQLTQDPPAVFDPGASPSAIGADGR